MTMYQLEEAVLIAIHYIIVMVQLIEGAHLLV